VSLVQLRRAYVTLQARLDGCQAELGTLGRLRAQAAAEELAQDERDLKARIEAGHPGYVWDPKSGTFTKAPPPAPSATDKK